MSSTRATLEAGRPRFSRPIRALARPLRPLALPIAGRRWFPFFAILRHNGRTSGKAYATPVVALRTPHGFFIPLPFGDATQWAKNLLASGGGALRFAGKDHRLGDPQIVDREDATAYLPLLVRFLSRRIGIRHFVLVRRLPD